MNVGPRGTTGGPVAEVGQRNDARRPRITPPGTGDADELGTDSIHGSG